MTTFPTPAPGAGLPTPAPAPTPLPPPPISTQPRKDRPPVFINKKRAYLGTGRRKTAVARVYLTEGTGKISINGRSLDRYFTEAKDRNAITGPLSLSDVGTRIDATIRVHGGGITGQSGACSQGIARALKAMFGLDKPITPPAEGEQPKPEDEAIVSLSKKLRDSGYLTRDGRMKERKKYGRKGARKAFQFSKR